jgi:hypothetical protein
MLFGGEEQLLLSSYSMLNIATVYITTFSQLRMVLLFRLLSEPEDQ